MGVAATLAPKGLHRVKLLGQPESQKQLRLEPPLNLVYNTEYMTVNRIYNLVK